MLELLLDWVATENIEETKKIKLKRIIRNELTKRPKGNLNRDQYSECSKSKLK